MPLIGPHGVDGAYVVGGLAGFGSMMACAAGELTAEDAAESKWWCTELQKRVIDTCLQLFGGYGYMLEYPIARAYCDSRVQTIYGGTTEIMKDLIGKSMNLTK